MTFEELNIQLISGEKIKLDLGCGPSKIQGSIGVDKINLPNVDIVADLELGLKFLPDNCVHEIYTSHFIEHIDNLEFLMKECHRVLVKNGILSIYVPHFSNPHFYSDYTHKRFFGLYTFQYFSDQNDKFKRKVPTFYTDFKFAILERKLIFKSPPFYFRNLFRQILQRIFNFNPYLQELFEDVFCYTFCCQELFVKLTPIK